jgi:hypothetical protein
MPRAKCLALEGAMVQPEFSPSDEIKPARSLAERLAAELNGDMVSSGECTSFSMARRFAPAIQEIPPDDTALDGPPCKPLPKASGNQIRASDKRRVLTANKALLAVLILVSLVPSATIGAMLWMGMVRTPWSGSLVAHLESSPLDAQQASIASSASPETIQPKQDAEHPSVALTVLTTVQAEAGKEVPFSIGINSADPLPPRSIINILGLPDGTTFSAGRSYGETGWALRPEEIGGDLRVRLPKTGETDLSIELVTTDGDIIASAFTHVNVATDPNSTPVLRPEESGRIKDLMEHGHKMVDVGYLAGARAYFRRAAEAGSADAAFALGDTYDPAFIDSIGAHGIKADVAQARTWYERARELGSEDAKAKLERQKNADDAQLTSVESLPSNGGTVGSAAPDADAHASVDPTPKFGEAAFPAGNQK